jgi:hypothetical protein
MFVIYYDYDTKVCPLRTKTHGRGESNMKWVIILVALLLVGLFIESKWEQKKKKGAKDEVASNEIYSAGEMISELKGKQDGK